MDVDISSCYLQYHQFTNCFSITIYYKNTSIYTHINRTNPHHQFWERGECVLVPSCSGGIFENLILWSKSLCRVYSVSFYHKWMDGCLFVLLFNEFGLFMKNWMNLLMSSIAWVFGSISISSLHHHSQKYKAAYLFVYPYRYSRPNR